MPPPRKVKILAVAFAIIVCTFLYFSDSSSQEFYTRTVTALDKKEASDREVAQELQKVKDTAKAQEPLGAPPAQKPLASDANPDDIEISTNPTMGESHSGDIDSKIGRERSVAGRKTIKGGEMKDFYSGKEAPKDSSTMLGKPRVQPGEQKEGKETSVASEEEHEIETELNSILKKGPIIIFSKSFCPYSAKAKKILLEKYIIVPAPYVVELDIHPQGRGLQDALGKSTGRRTVPNVLISGRSIGGGDDIEALDNSGGLVEKVKGMAGKRIVEAKLTEGN